VCPVVLRLVPDVYAVHEPPSKRYSRTSAMVPAPPEPAVAVLDTLVPVQTAPAAGEEVSVPANGKAFTVQLTITVDEVVHPEPVAVR
jgi:hypothetical protein